jgi:hypothetical protein
MIRAESAGGGHLHMPFKASQQFKGSTFNDHARYRFSTPRVRRGAHPLSGMIF